VGIAQKLRKIRTERKISLQELSSKTGLSVTFLSRLENDKANVSVLNLRTIAKALDIPIASLFSEDERSRVKICRPDQRRKMVLNVCDGKKVTEEWLLSDSSAKIEPAVITLPPGTNGGPPFAHEGDEFLWVLKGSLSFRLEDETISLEEGDSLYYPAELPHQFINNSSKKTRVLVVATPWSF